MCLGLAFILKLYFVRKEKLDFKIIYILIIRTVNYVLILREIKIVTKEKKTEQSTVY